MGQLEQWGLRERENPDSTSHVSAIAWENEKSGKVKAQANKSRQTLYERSIATEIDAPHEANLNYEYGNLFVEFDNGQVYQYMGVPYRYYYYLWKSPSTQGRWGEYIYHTLTRMSQSDNPRDPSANQRVCPFIYRRVK